MQTPTHDWEGLLNWVLGGIAAGFSALTVAVATMWQSEKQNNKERIEALEKSSAEQIAKLEAKLTLSEANEKVCREGHEKLLVEFARLETRLQHLEKQGCFGGGCHIKQ